MGYKTQRKIKGIDLMREVAEHQARDARQVREDLEKRRKERKK